jgi:hypothetical protein
MPCDSHTTSGRTGSSRVWLRSGEQPRSLDCATWPQQLVAFGSWHGAVYADSGQMLGSANVPVEPINLHTVDWAPRKRMLTCTQRPTGSLSRTSRSHQRESHNRAAAPGGTPHHRWSEDRVDCARTAAHGDVPSYISPESGQVPMVSNEALDSRSWLVTASNMPRVLESPTSTSHVQGARLGGGEEGLRRVAIAAASSARRQVDRHVVVVVLVRVRRSRSRSKRGSPSTCPLWRATLTTW